MIFFLGASMVAIQPACQKFGDKPMRRVKASPSGGSSTLKLIKPHSEQG